MATTNKFGLCLISFYSLEMVAEEGLREVITRWIIVLFIERDEITVLASAENSTVWHIG
jgi:hypothetical protein